MQVGISSSVMLLTRLEVLLQLVGPCTLMSLLLQGQRTAPTGLAAIFAVFLFLNNVLCLYCCSMLFSIKRCKTNFEIQTTVLFAEAIKIYSL